jgi:hypothetical protein
LNDFQHHLAVPALGDQLSKAIIDFETHPNRNAFGDRIDGVGRI